MIALAANVFAYVLVVRPLEVKSAGAADRARQSAAALAAAEKDLAAARALVGGKSDADQELSAFYQKVLPADLTTARRLTYASLPELARKTGVRYRGPNGLQRGGGKGREARTHEAHDGAAGRLPEHSAVHLRARKRAELRHHRRFDDHGKISRRGADAHASTCRPISATRARPMPAERWRPVLLALLVVALAVVIYVEWPQSADPVRTTSEWTGKGRAQHRHRLPSPRRTFTSSRSKRSTQSRETSNATCSNSRQGPHRRRRREPAVAGASASTGRAKRSTATAAAPTDCVEIHRRVRNSEHAEDCNPERWPWCSLVWQGRRHHTRPI